MLISALFFAILAGLMNGSYAYPLKHIQWPINITWLLFAIVTFLISPWVALWLLNSEFTTFIPIITMHSIALLSSGGFIFGIGMVLFTISLRYVGIGVSFLLNISAGTIIGSLLPVILLEPSRLDSSTGIFQLLGLLFFLIAILLTAKASKSRDLHTEKNNEFKGKNTLGILLGSLSGLLTSAQGFVYSYTLPGFQKLPLLSSHALLASSLPWAFIFNAAFIPYASYFFWQAYRNHEFSRLPRVKLFNYGYLFLMAICYFGSIIIFSKASSLLGDMGSVIAWPILMIVIILTANFWGFVQGEWRNAGKIAVQYELLSIALLIFAIVFLAIDGFLNLQGAS